MKTVVVPETLPPEVREWLSQSAAALVDAFAGDLQALILFGSAAEGRMRASSDVNLLVLLHRFDGARVDGARSLLQNAAAAVELHPMFLLTDELQLAAESFAEKFEDISNRHFMMMGDDPFKNLVIPRPLLIQRVRQVLLNLTLRLRVTYAVGPMSEEALAGIVADMAAPLRRSATAILELRGAQSESPKAALQQIAVELGDHWGNALEQLSQAREDLRLAPGTSRALIASLASLAESMQRLTSNLS